MIDKVTEEKCTGCGICSFVCPKECITMSYNDEGFIIPVINSKKCIQCQTCAKKCHVLNKNVNSESLVNPKTYAAYSKDEFVRKNSSSGGIFFHIAKDFIESNGIVYGAIMDDDLVVRHIRSDSMENCMKMMGSKYVQSEISLDIYKNLKKDLLDGKKVLFSGTPCQCSAIRQITNNKRLFLISFICHGVPSPKVWKRYVEYKELKNKDRISRVFFRDKTFGWTRFSLSLKFISGKKEINPLDKDLFMKAFLKNNCLRNSCYSCNYKGQDSYAEIDILLSDWWGAEDIPLFKKSDNKGISAIYINTSRGKDIWSKISSSLEYLSIDYNKASASNIAYNHPAHKGKHRDEFMASIDVMPFDKVVNKYCKTPMLQEIKHKITPFIYSIAKTTGVLKIYKKLR